MAVVKSKTVVKSKILEHLSDDFPNFLKKDLSKMIEITLSKIENALQKNERVELRDIFTMESRVQKSRISRNPKTQEKVEVSEKKKIKFRVSKKWAKKINEKA